MKPKKVTEEEWDKEVKRLEERYKVNRFSSSGKPPYGLDVPGFWWIVYGDDVRHLSRKDCRRITADDWVKCYAKVRNAVTRKYEFYFHRHKVGQCWFKIWEE